MRSKGPKSQSPKIGRRQSTKRRVHTALLKIGPWVSALNGIGWRITSLDTSNMWNDDPAQYGVIVAMVVRCRLAACAQCLEFIISTLPQSGEYQSAVAESMGDHLYVLGK